MTTPVWRHILSGIKSVFIAPPLGTGGTNSASYCYSVYLRHLVSADHHGLTTNPRKVIELGPGDSIGIGLMAILTGAEQYYAIDQVRHASRATNLLIFDELVKLLTAETPIPSGGNFSEILPELKDYSFPSKILNKERLTKTLTTDRLSRLRMTLESDLITGPICYLTQMGRMNEIPINSIDLIISQAVMEHVDNLEETYVECFRCLKPGGFMSHQIDLRCHGTALEWNGHWKYSDFIWGLMRGGRPWFINRSPCSVHTTLINQIGFKIHAEIKRFANSGISRRQLSDRFKKISENDLTTDSVLLLASKVL